MKHYLKLMRIHHYIKNLLIFVPLVCGCLLFNVEKLICTLIGFVAFCTLTSSVYTINDICDREKDKQHPNKSHRPIAAGKISLLQAWIFSSTLLMLSVFFNVFVFHLSSSLLLFLYFILNLAYSFVLKKFPIIDVVILAIGFIIRILYGAIIADITISNWLYLLVFSLAFYLALGKRRNELRKINDASTRTVLKVYGINFIDKNMTMCLTLSNVFYALWSVDEKNSSEYMIFTVLLVLLITMRYSFDIENESDGDPVEVLIHDKVLISLCALYSIIMLLFFYL